MVQASQTTISDTGLIRSIVDSDWPGSPLERPIRLGNDPMLASDPPYDEVMAELVMRSNRSSVVADSLQSYVLDELPSQLAQITAGDLCPKTISGSIESLLRSGDSSIDPKELASSPVVCRRALTLLDLTMVKRAIQLCGEEVPQVLMQSVDTLAKFLQLPSDLTYGLLIRNNPSDQLRTFTSGEAAQHERLFYHTHQLVEYELESACEALILLSEKSGHPFDLMCLNEASRRMQNVLQILETNFADFTADKFSQFREFLRKVDNAPGLSGAFSGNQHAIRFFTFGDALKNRFGLVEKQSDFFPLQDKGRLEWGLRHAQAGTGLASLVTEDLGDSVLRAAATFATLVYREMETHIKIAQRAIPQVTTQPTQGTGGYKDAGSFLMLGLRAAHEGLRTFIPFMSPDDQSRIPSEFISF